MQTPGRPQATTFELIEVVALREPGRVAVVEGTQEFSYAQLHVALARFSIALARLGVQRGQRVAVSRPSFFVQLCLLIACENVGAVSAAFLGDGDPDVQSLFDLMDWVLSEQDQEQRLPPGVRFQKLDAQFLQFAMNIDAQGGASGPRIALEMHEPQRIHRTSGSSGGAKFMVLSRKALEQWIVTGLENGDYSADTRLMVDGPLIMGAAFSRSCAVLRAGGCAMVMSAAELTRARITHLWCLPLQLEQLLSQLPPGYSTPIPVSVSTVGAALPASLRERAQRVFSCVVRNRYGANECAGVCDDLDATGIGIISAGVDLRIVDSEGRDLPMGEIGIIAVRTPAVVEGYINDSDATAASFREGWFYTGDLGALIAPRILRLAGRHDDLVNIGGIKLPAAQVEAQIRGLLDVQDCAVLAVNLPTASVGVVLVVDADTPQAPLMQQLAGAFQFGASVSARIVFVQQLPRMENGKLDRMALQRLLRNQSQS